MKATYVIAIATLLFCTPAQSKEVIWNVESKFGVSRENAKPGTDMALNAVAEHFKTNPGDQIVLQYNSGTYLFLGTDPSIDLPRDFDPGTNGRLIFEGEGMRNTIFITSDGSTPDINGLNVHRVTFRGIHFARNYLTVTQGTVVSVNAETEEVILELHSGFPTPEEIWSVPGKPLSQGKYLRKYTDDKSNPKVILENNRQVHYDPEKTYKIDSAKWAFKIDGRWSVARDEYKPGDIIGVKCKHGGNTYQFDGGSDIVFEDCLWTHRSRGVFKNGCTNIRFSRCRIERLSAINGRVPCLATPGGGPQIGQPNDPRIGDVVIEDCNFYSCGDDNLALFNVDGAIIRNTYAYNSFAANIKLYRCTDIVIENTEVENGYFIIREDDDGNEYFLYGLQNTIVNPSGVNVIEDVEGSLVFMLNQNFPNPFSAKTNISFSIPKRSFVILKIYNSLGVQVATLLDNYYPQGKYFVPFESGNLSNGIYFYNLLSNEFSDTKKMLIQSYN